MSKPLYENWRKYFESNGYIPLMKLDNDGKKVLDIDMFCDEDGYVPEELSEIYVLYNYSEIPCELLIILDIRNKECTDLKIKSICSEWDNKILSFINFGNFHDNERKSKYLLKYNVMQILLCDTNIARSSTAMSEEKSTDISRKLFISIEKDDVIEAERSMLPFYFEQITSPDIAQETELTLKTLLPETNDLSFLYEMNFEDNKFTEMQFLKVKEWLSSATD